MNYYRALVHGKGADRGGTLFVKYNFERFGRQEFFPLFFSPLPFLSRRDDDCTSRVRGRDFCFLFFPLNF